MPDVLSLVLLAVIVLLAGLLLRRRDTPGSGLLQQQLIELRQRVEALTAAQREVPQLLAEERAAHTVALSRELTRLSDAVGDRLDASHGAVGDRLAETGRAMAEVRERLGQLAEATRRLEAVGASVQEVQELLRVPKLRGTLGEIWLEELLREIFPAALVRIQHTFRSGERVDAVVELGGRLLPVDAKFPLEECQRLLAAAGADADRARRALRRSLRDRIDEIADKYIRPDEGTFEFALMYIPAERVYHEAVVQDERLDTEESLLGYAMRRRVIPVSPHTFYAYLSAILHGLRGLHMNERAQEIQGELGGLAVEMGRFQTAFQKVGVHLGNALKQYDESEREIAGLGERLRRLGEVPGGALER